MVSAVILCIAVYSATTIPIFSPDFFWHLSSGRYILTTGSIPDEDPFAYTSLPDDPDSPGRPQFILKQYWLSQAIYALIQERFGFEGIIILRGVLYAAFALMAYALSISTFGRRASILPIAVFAMSLKVCIEDTDRPQNFAFLSALAVVLIMEYAIRKNRKWAFYLNAPLMLISAQMHGGFIVGQAYLFVYSACSLFEGRLKAHSKHIISSAMLSFALSSLNPTGFAAYGFITAILQSSPLVGLIMEYQSPLTILPGVLKNYGWASYFALAAISIPSAVLLLKDRRFSHAALLICTLSASLYSMRFIPFFLPLGAVFSARVIVPIIKDRLKSHPITVLAVFAVAFSAPILLSDNPNKTGIKQTFRTMFYPEQAADFILKEGLPKEIYNDMKWGGYLQWRLYPQYKVFFDSRQLMTKVFLEYVDIFDYNERGRKLIDSYGISTIITPSIVPYTGAIIPLVRGLYKDPKWVLAYSDGICLIFVRKGMAKKELPKGKVYYQVLLELESRPKYQAVDMSQLTRQEAEIELGFRKKPGFQ